MVVLLLMWLALSAVATLAFVFGSSLGYRRGLAEATGLPDAPDSDLRVAAGSSRDVRLPEDVPSGT